MVKTRLLCSVAIGLFGASSAFAQEEAAQAGADAPVAQDTIVITGSYIRGTPEDAALPVDVFSSEELSQSGVTSPLEFIKQLPSVGSVLGETNQFDGSAQGSQGQGSVNLRGLGQTRTLVLLDGKRTLQAPGQGYTDTNFIPLFALERIEILKDGAAATYGSDAIAGVANFITRSNFTGVEMSGDWTFIDGSDDNYTISGLAGVDIGDGRGNFMIGAGWQHRSELPSLARDFVFPGYDENNSGYSALAAPGQFLLSYLGDGGVSSRVVQEGGCTDLGGVSLPFSIALPASIATPDTACQFTYVPFDNLIEEEDRYQVFGSLDVDFTDRLRLNIDALYAQTDTDAINSSPSYPILQGPNGPGAVNAFTVGLGNPFITDFLAANGLPPAVGPDGTLVAASVFLARPFGFLGNPAERGSRGANGGRANNVGYRVAGDLTYELNDNLELMAGATWWRSEREFGYPDIVGSRLQNALNGLGGAGCDPATGTPGVGACQYFNPFTTASPGNPAQGLANPLYVPGNENSRDLVRYIQPFNGRDETEEQFVGDLVLSGEVGAVDLGAGPLAFAVGGQYRKNNFERRPINAISDVSQNPCYIEGDLSCVGTSAEGAGPFIFLGNWASVSQVQDVYAAFAEVNLPLMDGLEVTGAVRYEDYGDPIGSTFNPKGSFRWEATDFLTLRGSVGTTFRAPLPGQVDTSFVTSLQGIQVTGNNYKAVDIFGNPTLKPETAFTYNVGGIINTGGLTVSVDFWTYEFDDQITLTPYNAIGNSLIDASIPVTSGTPFIDCSAPLADLATFDGGSCVQGTTRGVNIARLRTDWVNGPSVTVRGLDFAVNYDIDAGFGMFSVGGNATWNLEYAIDDFELRGLVIQDGYDAVGFGNYARDPRTLPEWKGNAYVNFNMEDALNLRYTLNYISSVTDDRCTAAGCPNSTTRFGEESGSYVRQDIIATYNFQLSGLDLQLLGAVNNIFDEAPAEAALPLSFTQYVGDALGRHYQVGLKANF